MTHPLPIVGYINPLVADALRDPTSGINTTQLRAEPNARVSGAVVMKTDADAEIARLRNHLERIDGLIMGNHDPVKIFCGIHASCEQALKGPEA